MPPNTTEEHLEFLDDLREDGITNMFGAAPFLQREFPDLTKREAREILIDWMRTFESRHPTEERTE